MVRLAATDPVMELASWARPPWTSPSLEIFSGPSELGVPLPNRSIASGVSRWQASWLWLPFPANGVFLDLEAGYKEACRVQRIACPAGRCGRVVFRSYLRRMEPPDPA